MSKKTTLFEKFNLILLLCTLLAVYSYAQPTYTSDNWYFGSPTVASGLRIDFSSGTPVVSRNYPIQTEEGSSSISDASGVPLFYTDGLRIWDASTNTAFGTGLLGGTSTTQSAIIMPRPGSTNQWLVFTSGQTGTNGIHFYTVTGAPGSFTISAATNLAAANTVGEGLFIIGSTKAGSSFWVIARDLGNTGQVRAWDVLNTGVVNTTPVLSTLSNTGWTQTDYLSKIGTIKSNTCQNQLAFTYLSGDVDLTNFNTTTGQVVANTARRITVASTGGNNGSYGIEFSGNDTYLYITNLAGNRLYRHDIAANTTATLGPVTPYEAGQLQAAPDGKIYMAINGETNPGNGYLGVIDNPNSAGATFTPNGLLVTTSANPNGYSFRGLPTFPKSLVVSTPDITPTSGTYCVNTAIPLSYTFAGSVNPATISWTATGGGQSFSPGGTSSIAPSPSVTFSTTGAKTVTLTFQDACGRSYTQTSNFTIVTPKVPAGAISCTGTSITLTATGSVPGDYPNYIWYNASSGGNVVATGSPVTLNFGDMNNVPASYWVEVGGSVSTTSSGTNQSIGMATAGLSWAANNSPYGPVPFTVLSNRLTLRSFVVKTWTGGGNNFDVVIRNASSVIVFQKTYTAAANGVNTTVNINTEFMAGNYTITLTSGAGIQWYGGTWSGGTNASQITLPTFGGAGTYSLANLVYDYVNFSVTTTCSNRIQVDRLCSLPVELLTFSGKPSENTITLDWVTASELNNDYFEIQCSTDGINFSTIGTMKGNGTSSSINIYQFTDYNPSFGKLYYRLAQYDYDGALHYSQTIAIQNGFSSSLFNVSPNPSQSDFTIQFSETSGGQLQVIDVIGKVVAGYTIEEGTQGIAIGSELAKGIYIVQLSTANGSFAQRIVKE